MFVGKGETEFSMDKGNFDITDRVYDRIGLSAWTHKEGENAHIITMEDDKGEKVKSPPPPINIWYLT